VGAFDFAAQVLVTLARDLCWRLFFGLAVIHRSPFNLASPAAPPRGW
jgi:hypothetical protein